VQLLVVDGFLFAPFSDWERRDTLEVAEGRNDTGATSIAIQYPIKDWHPAIGDPTLVDAIYDRLVLNAYRLEMRGEYMRRKNAIKNGSPLEGKGNKRIVKSKTIN
jgi:DNA replication protein DnaC